MVAGDFNTHAQPIKFLKNISGNEPTFKRNILGKLTQSKTDWVLTKKDCETTLQRKWHGYSDHYRIICYIEIKNSQLKNNIMKIPDKKICKKLCEKSSEKTLNSL